MSKTKNFGWTFLKIRKNIFSKFFCKTVSKCSCFRISFASRKNKNKNKNKKKNRKKEKCPTDRLYLAGSSTCKQFLFCFVLFCFVLFCFVLFFVFAFGVFCTSCANKGCRFGHIASIEGAKKIWNVTPITLRGAKMLVCDMPLMVHFEWEWLSWGQIFNV